MKSLFIIITIIFSQSQFCYAQTEIDTSAQNEMLQKLEILSAFKDHTKPHFFLNTGNEIDEISGYLRSPRGFSIHFYSEKKEEIEKGSSFVVSLIKEPFFELIKEFEDEFRKILNGKYDEIVTRLKNGEKFFLFEKGKVNKLILCGQNKQDIVELLNRLLSPTFQTDALDRDKDGLPDYFEERLKTNPRKIDTDKDGLTDFDECYKYLTNPLLKDTDEDGIPDNDWHERREYTYTIKVKREIYPPFNSEEMNDFFQDTRVIRESKDTLIFETILFPEAINFIIPSSKPIDKQNKQELIHFTMPSYFCNYTNEMKNELESLIQEWKLNNNYELVQAFARYATIISNSYPYSYKGGVPLEFCIEVNDKKIDIVHQKSFDELKTAHFVTDERVFNHLAFGEAMYRNRMRGSCSSAAIFYNTLFRVISIPTRIVSSNPIINYSDTMQIKLAQNLQNERYRNVILSKVSGLKGNYANHFFYEIYINGRWIRCNYDDVNINCVHGLGLFIVEDKFIDFSERNFARTWGSRLVNDEGNPYETIELSDQLPIHRKWK